MAIISVPGLEIPRAVYATSAPGNNANAIVLDAAGEKGAYIITPPKSGSIRKVGTRLGTVTTATNLDVRIETVASRFPTGTLWGTNTNAILASGSLSSNAYIEATLTADAVVTEEDIIAVVFAPAGTPNIGLGGVTTGQISPQLPYMAHFTASWAAIARDAMLTVEYSDGSCYEMANTWPVSFFSNITANTGTTPDEIALKFTLPFTAQIGGFWVCTDMLANFDVVLYDAADNVLESVSVDFAIANFVTGTARSPYRRRFTTKQLARLGSAYRLAIKPTTVTNVVIPAITIPHVQKMDQLQGGQNMHQSVRTNAGAWTDSTLERPLMGLIIDGINMPFPATSQIGGILQ